MATGRKLFRSVHGVVIVRRSVVDDEGGHPLLGVGGRHAEAVEVCREKPDAASVPELVADLLGLRDKVAWESDY